MISFNPLELLFLAIFFMVGDEMKIVRKSVRWSAVPVPCLSRLCLKLKGKQGSGPEGVDDLCFHTYGEFSPAYSPSNASLEAQIPILRPKSQPGGPNPCLKAQILA